MYSAVDETVELFSISYTRNARCMWTELPLCLDAVSKLILTDMRGKKMPFNKH